MEDNKTQSNSGDQTPNVVTPSPAVSTPVAPQNTSSTPPSSAQLNTGPVDTKKPKNNKKLLTILGAVLGLLLLSGLAFAYFTVWGLSPEQKIQKALAKSFSSESLAFNAEFNIEDENFEQSGFSDIAFDGQVSMVEEKMKMKFSAKLNNEEISLELLSKSSDKLYLKLMGMSLLAENPDTDVLGIATALAPLEGKYIMIDNDSLKEAGLTDELLVDPTKELSEEDKKKLGEIIKDSKFFKVTEKLAKKDISGKAATGYVVELDKEGVREFLNKLKDANIESINLDDEDIDKFMEDLEGDSEGEEKTRMEIWLAGGRIAQVVFADEENSEKNNFKLTFDKYNEDFDVSEPKDAMTFEEATSLIFGGPSSPTDLQLEPQPGGSATEEFRSDAEFEFTQ